MMEERMLTFIHSFDSEKPAYLDALERYAKETNVPIIRPQMQSLLRLLVTWGRPVQILEVGTAIGFSALLMSEYAPKGCHITTIEKYEKRIPLAKENFEKAGKSDCITLLEGDAAEILASMKQDGAFDLIFMDAAKGQYIHFLPDIRRLLSPTGLLVSDNILQDGELMESKYAVIRRNRTIHNRMRAYLYELTHCEELETTILPIADGVALSAKRSAQTGKEMGDKKE
ncbi:MAG: O-methyltransferase [Lachnospiraceae bacterium]|nr:O-methyltransferase [Lachnospiraceae bacterium]MCI8974934.1 O-methyltransferase [Lachnospiraceae bacterium]